MARALHSLFPFDRASVRGEWRVSQIRRHANRGEPDHQPNRFVTRGVHNMMSSNSSSAGFGRAGESLASHAREAANSTVDSARRAGQEIGAATRTEFNNILADLQDLAARAGKASGRELAVLREQMSDKLGVAKEKLSSLTGDAAVAARKGIDATESAIQGRPFQSVAAAAIIGFAIGLFIGRR